MPSPFLLIGYIRPLRSQLPIYLIISIVAHLSLNLSYEHVLRVPEKVLSASDDSAGIESIVMAMRLSRG